MLWMWFKRHSPSRAVLNPNIYSKIRISTQKCMNRLSPYISMGIPQPPRGSGMRNCSAGAHTAVLPRKGVFGFRIHSSSDWLNFVYVPFSIRSLAFLASALFLDVCKANLQLHTRLLRNVIRNVRGQYHKIRVPFLRELPVTKRGLLSWNRV
jgi:hypothetical protein